MPDFTIMPVTWGYINLLTYLLNIYKTELSTSLRQRTAVADPEVLAS